MTPYRTVSPREMEVLERLLAAGHPYKHMSDMLGRSVRSIKRIACYYQLPKHPRYNAPATKMDTEMRAAIIQKMIVWVEDERCTMKTMHRRIELIFGVKVHYATACALLKELPKDVRMVHTLNVRALKSRKAELQHKRKRMRKENERRSALPEVRPGKDHG